MHSPFISSTSLFFPVWSGFSDPSLRPTLMVARDGSGYRPVEIAEFGGDILISGITVSNKPALPVSQGTYGISLTGTGSFSNYSSSIPTATGAVVSLSVEPHSDNNDIIYYAFSGNATTGNAWEIRGDRTFEIVNNSSLFFAQRTSGQIVMVHFQTF